MGQLLKHLFFKSIHKIAPASLPSSSTHHHTQACSVTVSSLKHDALFDFFSSGTEF
jgi:hypothetical protein